MITLDELISNAKEMKPLPATTLRLASVVSSQHADLDEICDIIAYDQVLTMALLRAANSAATASTNEVTQVHEAVFRLGAARVLALAVSKNTQGLLKQDAPAYGLNEGALWRHSVAAAVAAEIMSEFTAIEIPLETFSAALLHDLGKLAMSRYMSEFDLAMIRRAQEEGGLDPLSAESQILGVHHGELGGLIAQHWQLPPRIVAGITYHHKPTDGNDLICDAVYLANRLARHVENTGDLSDLETESLGSLGLTQTECDALSTSIKSHFETVSARYQQ